MGAEDIVCGDAAAVADQVRDWAGTDGVGVLIETTGVPAVVRSAFGVVAPAGRLVLVALSHTRSACRSWTSRSESSTSSA